MEAHLSEATPAADRGPDWFRRGCASLIPFAERLASIHFEVLGTTTYDISAAIKNLFECPMPHLSCLRFSAEYQGYQYPLNLTVAYAPLLESLKMTGLCCKNLHNCAQLRHVELEITDDAELVYFSDLLRGQISIIHLTISGELNPFFEDGAPTLSLPCLTSLRITKFNGVCAVYLRQLIGNMAAPKLVSLQLLDLNNPVYNILLSALVSTTFSNLIFQPRLTVARCDSQYRLPLGRWIRL